MFGRLCTVLALSIPLFLAYIVHDLRTNLGHGKHIDFNDDSCTLLEAPVAIEDFSAVGDGHCVIGGGGDIKDAFEYGSEVVKEGGVYLVNVTQGTIRKLFVIESKVRPGLPKLVLHGVFYSQRSRRLYAVNHDQQRGESIEVFQVTDTQKFDLEHLASVRSEIWAPFALNDVVEGASDDELYVTQWLPFGFPRAGAKHPSLTFTEKVEAILMLPINLFRIRTTRVYRCKYGVGDSEPYGQCEVASPHRFVMANGIAISDDRQTVYVSDPTGRAIVTLKRVARGKLEYVSQFQPLHTIDNIEVGPDGHLHGGSIPIAFASFSACDHGLGDTVTIGGRSLGCGRCPGGLLQMSVGSDGAGTAQADVLMHDGSKLHQVAAALKVGDRVVLGSPASPGALVCAL